MQDYNHFDFEGKERVEKISRRRMKSGEKRGISVTEKKCLGSLILPVQPLRQ